MVLKSHKVDIITSNPILSKRDAEESKEIYTKFGITVGPRENGSKYLDEDGYMNFEGMFDLTKYNASDELILHVEYKGKDEKITLKKVEG